MPLGCASELAEGPALALGASEANLLQMTAAYAGILNGGSAVRPYGIEELKLLGDSTPLFGVSSGIGERVISERSAQMLTWMMSRVLEEGTGRRAKLPDHQAAGKNRDHASRARCVVHRVHRRLCRRGLDGHG